MIGRVTLCLVTLCVFVIVLNSVQGHEFGRRSKALNQRQFVKELKKLIAKRKHLATEIKPQTTTPTTTTTTSTTTEEPESEASRRVRNNFEFVRNITSKISFSFEEANENFESRLDIRIIPVFPTCDIHVPYSLRFALDQAARTIQKLAEKVTCDNGAVANIKIPVNKSKKRRHRREVDCLEMVQNPDGSQSCVKMCREQGTIREGGIIQSCTECDVITTLPADV